MKKDIHPDYRFFTVTMTDGSTFVTRSTVDNGGAMQLVIDSKNHPAYTGERRTVDSMGRIEKFAKKYGMAKAK